VKHICTLTLMGALLGAAALNAQNPLSTDLKGSYTGIKSTIIKAADEMLSNPFTVIDRAVI